MKRHLCVYVALAMCLIGSAVTPSLNASESDKQPIITIDHQVAVRGTILQPGKYTLKVRDLSTHVVYIYNGDGTRLITVVMANHAYRLDPADKSLFSFYETSSGQAAALHSWFYPGDNDGFDFPRPKQRAAVNSSAAGN
jgi:hypothetical protein